MIVVLGAGVAGLCAVERLAAANVPVTLLTAGAFGVDTTAAGNTALAQGGIAAALGNHDSPGLHAADTVNAGAGLVDPVAAELLATEGAHRLGELINAGFPADRGAAGNLKLGLEAAHSQARIIHAGEDSSGAVLSTFLTHRVEQLIRDGIVQLIDQAHVTELVIDHGCISQVIYDSPAGPQRLDASAVLVATGGYAGLYATASASAAITGQGTLAAARAGVVLADTEFVQFHPTALPGSGELISEAVRGAGAVLRDAHGQRFMPDAHPAAELAPRDVVSRACFATMQRFDTQNIWFDATVIEARDGPGTLAGRFPRLTQTLDDHGIDWTRQYVPVAPAAHYCMGGVATDSWGRSSVPGLFAAGEAASTGVHGANRLASNSLLEGIVFGARAAEAATYYLHRASWAVEPQLQRLIDSATTVSHAHRTPDDATQGFGKLQELVTSHLGIIRDHDGLTQLLAELEDIAHPLADLVQIMATAALHRTESRGGHWRADHPTTDSAQAARTGWRFATAHNTSAQPIDVCLPQEISLHVDA